MVVRLKCPIRDTTVRRNERDKGAGVAHAPESHTQGAASARPANQWASDAADAVTGTTGGVQGEKVDRLVRILGTVVDGLDTADLEAEHLGATSRVDADAPH